MEHSDSIKRTWPELLAAYVDGELSAHDERWVEAQLRLSPRDRQTLRDQHAFSGVNAEWAEAIEPRMPTPLQWARIWNQIESGLEPSAPDRWVSKRSNARRGLWSAIAAVLGVAVASVALAVLIPSRTGVAPMTPQETAVELEGVFPVTLASDVEIHSIREADIDRLVVGEPPLRHGVLLAEHGDVQINAVRADVDGVVPQLQMGGWNDAPLMYASTPRTP